LLNVLCWSDTFFILTVIHFDLKELFFSLEQEKNYNFTLKET